MDTDLRCYLSAVRENSSGRFCGLRGKRRGGRGRRVREGDGGWRGTGDSQHPDHAGEKQGYDGLLQGITSCQSRWLIAEDHAESKSLHSAQGVSPLQSA